MLQKIAGMDVSRETIQDLEAFGALVTRWTPKINLIAKASAHEVWERHIVDSVQIYRYAPKRFETWVDLGSGGGFPGIVMAILGKAKQPDARFILIESDQRKATFLRTAIRELAIPGKVMAERIEAVPPQSADIVSARALTALSSLLPLVARHLAPNGVALLHKGKQASQEVAEAQKLASFELEDHVSFTDPDARILAIQRIVPRG